MLFSIARKYNNIERCIMRSDLKFNFFMTILGLSALILTVVTCVSVFSEADGDPVTDNLAYTIVIDAGHGGIDGGVIGTKSGVKESDLNLKVARELYGLLKENGFNVIMTRTDENGLYGDTSRGFKRRDMLARKEIINRAAPDLVVSIHMNFYSASYRRGAQVFFQKGSAAGKNFADAMQTALNRRLDQNNLNLPGDFFICRESSAPAIIVECGFLSNPDDEKLLLTSAHRKKLATAILDGCVSFLFS